MYHPAAPFDSRTWRHFSISPFSGNPFGLTATIPASLAWPLANVALYIPMYVNETVTVYEAGVGAGATAGGNFDIGIYQMDGTKVVSSGTTARTASAWNTAGLTDTELAPGWYYAAMSANGVDNYFGVNPAAGICEAMGIAEQTSAFVLPSPATISTRTTRAAIPTIAFAVRSVAL